MPASNLCGSRRRNTMILHWLKLYPLSFLFCIIGGCIGLLGNCVRLLTGLGKNTTAEVWTYALGMVFGISLAADYVLRVWTPYKHIAEVLGLVGAVSAITYSFLLLNAKRTKRSVTAVMPEPAAPSDKIWPPPPTSPGG